MSGDQIGDYQLLGLLNPYYPMVYHAEHIQSGEVFVLKLVTPTSSGLIVTAEPEIIRLFSRAAPPILRFSVLPVDSIAEENGNWLAVISRPVSTTKNLWDLIEAGQLGRKIPDWYIALTAFRLLTDLEALHLRGWLHNDLKPENIFLQDSQVEWPLPLLGDFGLAFALPCPPGARHWGTSTYLAPEKWVETEVFDQRADIWGLGLILYAMHSGFDAFAPCRSSQLKLQVRGRRFQRPLPVVGSAGCSQLDDFINQALTVDPLKRPTASDLLDHPLVADWRSGKYSPEEIPWVETVPDSTTLEALGATGFRGE
jgi:serine/threonine protein kinase